MNSAQHHFGPEPKLIPNNNLSSSRQKAISHPIGTYATHTNAIHFRIPFHFGDLNQNIAAAQTRMNDYTNKVKHYDQKIFNCNSTSNTTLRPNTWAIDILAIGSTQLYNNLSASDLAYCLHLGGTFFCKGRRELRTDIENNCLMALYFGMPESVKNQYQFRITTTEGQFLPEHTAKTLTSAINHLRDQGHHNVDTGDFPQQFDNMQTRPALDLQLPATSHHHSDHRGTWDPRLLLLLQETID